MPSAYHVLLNKYEEVADFVFPVNQFYDGKRSKYACGPYCVASAGYMGAPTKGPTGTTAKIDQLAFDLYQRYIGPDVDWNANGTTIPNLYCMLADITLPFFKRDLSVEAIKAGIARGRPLIVGAAETGMHDMDNGEKVDYAWIPSGNHIIIVSGIRSRDGALLVRDFANIGAQGQRGPNPVAYDPAKFGPIVSVTELIPPWQVPALTPLMQGFTLEQSSTLTTLFTALTQAESSFHAMENAASEAAKTFTTMLP